MQVGVVRAIHRYPVKSMAGEVLKEAQLSAAGIAKDRIYAVRDDVAGEIRSARKWPALMTCRAQVQGDAVRVTLPDGTALAADDASLAPRLSKLLGRPVSVCPLEPASNLAHYRRKQATNRLAGVLSKSPKLLHGLQRIAEITGMDAELRAEFGRAPGEPSPDLTEFTPETIEFASIPGTYFDAHPLHLLTTASLAHLAQRAPEASWDARRFRPNLLLETAPELTGLVENGWSGRRLRIGEVVIACLERTIRCSMVTQPQPELGRDTAVLRSIVRDAEQKLGVYATVESPGRVRAGDSVELL
jgi:uncharacterized protein YcbX